MLNVFYPRQFIGWGRWGKADHQGKANHLPSCFSEKGYKGANAFINGHYIDAFLDAIAFESGYASSIRSEKCVFDSPSISDTVEMPTFYHLCVLVLG